MNVNALRKGVNLLCRQPFTHTHMKGGMKNSVNNNNYSHYYSTHAAIKSSTSSNGSSVHHKHSDDCTHHVYASKKPTPVSIKMMLEHTMPLGAGSLLRTGRWILDELPIRLAVQVKAIDRLPFGLCLMPSVRRVRKWYIESIKELHECPKLRGMEDEDQFAQLLRGLYDKHSKTLIAMCKGLDELKRELKAAGDIDLERDLDVTQFMDDFYMSRIGIRMLAGHYLALHDQLKTPLKDYVGLICTRTSPAQVVQDAIHDARFMCVRTHGDAPEVIFHGTDNLTFNSVPSYIYYIIFELLKNSMRAVTEKHGKNSSGHLYSADGTNKVVPPIKVVVADSKENEDVAIKISDEGGGIRRSHYPKIWSYLYTTANADFPSLSSFDEPDDFGTQGPLAGLGCGLPLSRLYARYFGGDLQLLSMEGYGTDAYLHLPRLADKTEPMAINGLS